MLVDQNGQPMTLHAFSEMIRKLGIKVNKIKKIVKQSGGGSKLNKEKDDAKKDRKLIKEILQNTMGKQQGQMQRERLERIKAVFEKIDSKLESIDIELMEEENATTNKTQVGEIEDEFDDKIEYLSYGKDPQRQSLIVKEVQKESLTGWQKKHSLINFLTF